jgi:outer membrane protein assembly factor BamB
MSPCILALALLSSDWPQWRGPYRDGTAPGKTWPATLEKLPLSWRVDLAEGYPGPVIAGNRVYVAETRDRKDEVVRCLDRKTGKQLWEASWKGAMTVPFFAASNGSWIRSTPTVDGDLLFVAGMRDVVVCLDAKTGKIIWNADLMERYSSPLPAFGQVTSPLVDGAHLYVQAGASVLKLDKKTGETVWRSLKDGGGMYGSAFSSPVIATLVGKRQLVVQTRTTLAGLDLSDGKKLWSVDIPAFRGMNILTPTVVKDAIFTSAYGAKSYLYRIEKEGDGFRAKLAWDLKLEGYMSSPVVIDGHAYLHLRNQRLTCIDLEAGKVKWTTGKAFGKYWSMTSQGDRILALDERGVLYLIKANPEKYELLSEKKVSKQESWAHLAVVDGEVYVRELKGLSAYRWE